MSMPPLSEPFDVIIVGGRPAGASLAMRLGDQGLRVLIVERDTFPSAPPVSVPFLINSSMALLDELGLEEAEYAGDAPRLRRFVIEVMGAIRAPLTVSPVGGRDYVYVVDRALLDTALWRALSRRPTVTALEGVSFAGVLRGPAGEVCGVRLSDGQTATAPWVVGADGRYSPVAREVGAAVTEQRADVETTLHYGYWRGVAPYEGDPTTIQIHSTGDGYSAIVMPTTQGRSAIVYQGRADRYNADGQSIDEHYRAGLRRCPTLEARLGGAALCSKLVGMKRIGNLYRQAAGPGWALVGDAFHQKDSIDAQGIYDALIEAKLLASVLGDWKRGDVSAVEAGARYAAEAVAATRPMFQGTMERLKREIYTDLPPWVARTVLRWMMTDAEYLRRASLVLSRQMSPAEASAPGVMLGALGRGLWADLRGAPRS